MNKAVSKDIFRLNDLPVAADLRLKKSHQNQIAELLRPALGWPAVVKPASEGSSFGVNIVKDAEELTVALEQAFTLDEEVIIEEFLDGIEITCGVIDDPEPRPLPLIEIIPPQGAFFDYQAKYVAGRSQEICPARIAAEAAKIIQDLAVKAHNVLNLRGYSRSDFILTSTRGPFILETNTVPGMTDNSLLPLAAGNAGIAFPQLVDKLVQMALQRRP